MSLSPTEIQRVIKHASESLAKYCMKFDIHATVTGISGGLDSAVTLALANKASEYAFQKGFVIKNIGLVLPCHSDEKHAVFAKKIIKKFKAELIEIDLSAIFDKIEKSVLKPLSETLSEFGKGDRSFRYRTAQGNVKARLRMALGTYFVANMVSGIVLSTDNYSEYWMGFWTLHGDVGDFGMIQELWKGDEVPTIARALNVPEEIINQAPTDGLGIDAGGDEGQLGAPYHIVDRILKELIKNGIDLNGSLNQLKKLPEIPKIDPVLVQKIALRAIKNSFKRKNPKNLKREEFGLIN